MRWVLFSAIVVGGLMAKEPPAAQKEPPRWELIRPEPVPYPPSPRQARIQGVVPLRMRVEKDRWLGKPVEIEAIDGHPLLKAQAVASAQQWQFERVQARQTGFSP
jgi:outer membrane biosynthesis protein TonB